MQSLRKELELLKGEVLKAEAATVEAGTKYDNEIRKVRELQVQFKAANDVRQEAYAKWLSLRKELSEKVRHIFSCILEYLLRDMKGVHACMWK